MSSRVYDCDGDRGVTPLVWREVRAEPVGSLAEAEEEFREQRARMEHDCERRIREARAAGLQEGEATGRAQGAAELQPVLQRLSGTIAEIASLRVTLRRQAESDMVKLSLAIARRILRRELSIDPEALHGLTLAALEKLQGQEVCRVRVHPAYAAAIAAYLRDVPGAQQVQIVSDAGSEPGHAVFETARGNLDASVESQLQEIERGLADQLKRHG